jgi:hypothetical protein
MRKKILYVGWLIFFLGIYLGNFYWYSGEDKDSSGTTAALCVILFCGIGVAIISWYIYEVENLKELLFPMSGVLIILLFLNIYYNAVRELHLKDYGKETIGIVHFREFTLDEIKYSYVVEGKLYFKSDTDPRKPSDRYISHNKIQVGDTLLIRYWENDPNYHNYTLFSKLKKN